MITPALKQIEKIMREAGELLQRSFGNPTGVHKKNSGWVSDVDIEVEQFYRQKLTELIKGSSFWGEEGGKSDIKSDYTWIVDPLDGSYNYISGVPLFVTGVALSYQDNIIYSAVYDVMHNEFYYAFADKAFLNNNLLKTSKQINLQDAMISLYSCDKKFAQIRKSSGGVRRFGSALLIQCWVASGRLGGAVFGKMFWWDVAPALLIMKNSGILVTDFYNQDVLNSNFKNLVCASANVHSGLIELL